MDLKLVMFKPNGQRKDFPLRGSVSVLGRGENCDLRVPLVSVSRRHCEITVSGDQVKVKDLASSNGTYVNNQRVNESLVKAGDRLVVGPVVFTVQIDGVPEEIKPIRTRAERAAEPEEDIVALEANGGLDTEAFPTPAEVEEDIDPIAALEALAAESKKKEDKQ